MPGKKSCALPNNAPATNTLNHHGWRDRIANSDCLLAILECEFEKESGLYE
jgi:hypothetical protein